jgi:hypothetical protein
MTNVGEITKITQKEVQPHMVKQLLLPPSSQLGLGNLPIFVLGNKQNHWWKMDQKYLVERRIKIPIKNKYFLTPTKQRYSK